MYIYGDIAFRPIEKDDLEDLRRLHNDHSTFLNLHNIDMVDEIDQIVWWENLHNIRDDKRFSIVKSENLQIVIGRLRIQNINFRHNNCEIGIDILPEYRKKGYGYKSYKMLLEFLFQHYNINMVYLKVAEFNPKARKLYTKVGFQETGRFPEAFFRHGKYWDYLIMSITKDMYFSNVESQH